MSENTDTYTASTVNADDLQTVLADAIGDVDACLQSPECNIDQPTQK